MLPRLLFALPLLALGFLPAQAPPLEPGPPASVGCDAEGLEQAVGVIADLVARDEVRGAVVLVARGRTVVLHRALGHADLAGKRPMTKDALFRMASNTKAVTAAAILALCDGGELTLDDPVRRWLPTFGEGDAAKITIRHLLTHTSGLRIGTLFLQPLMKPSEEHPDAPNLVLEATRFGEVGPEVEPGTTYSYNNPGYNTLAAIVELASGQGLAPFCRARFYAPLGMADTCNHETRADLARMAVVARKDEKGAWRARWSPGDPPTVPFVRGSGGLICSATDFARFCRLWLDDGRCSEQVILSPAAIAAATRSQTGHIPEVSYGFGWRIDGDGRFSHGGSDGTWAFCDRARDLVGLVLTQTQSSKALDAGRERFRALVEEACPPR